MARENFAPRDELVRSLARFPELRFLDRWDALVPLLLVGLLWVAGALAERVAPELGTSGAQMAVWGFCVSTVVLYHATFSINSLAHRFGTRRYATRDASRNNLWLALLTFGEGWHNNHHHYPASARQGFFWWEIDLTFYGLRLLAALGLIHGLKPVPAAVRDPAAGRAEDAR
jgi:stearoyl-CoA desaturase (delta-9 desaturase)